MNKSKVMPALWELTNNAVTMLYVGDFFLNVYANRSERDPAPLRKDNMNAYVKYFEINLFLKFLTADLFKAE